MKTKFLVCQGSIVFCLASLLFVSRIRAIDDAATPQEDHPVEDASKFKLQPKPHPSLPTLFLVGDSTMKVGTPGQRGWGDDVAPYFDLNKINVVNEAIGGRSSRTYQTEGRWGAVLAMVKKGDYVVIQFGHNDSGALNDKPGDKNARSRGTIKGNGEETQQIDNSLTHKHEVVHSFGWYMRKYATDVKAKGATPIVMSLVPRNSWADGKVARASGEAYGGWAQQAAQATGSIFVDDNDLIASGLEAIGQDKALPLFGDGKLHASPAGAAFNARMAVLGLKQMPGNPLAAYFSAAAEQIPASPADAAK
jgi:lysophospholipase L1-like esterase